MFGYGMILVNFTHILQGYTDNKALELSEIIWLQLGNCHEQCGKKKKTIQLFLDINVMAKLVTHTGIPITMFCVGTIKFGRVQ